MRESGFRRQTLIGQRELVRAVAHIAPGGLQAADKAASIARETEHVKKLGRRPQVNPNPIYSITVRAARQLVHQAARA
jgi:hypothetical protein